MVFFSFQLWSFTLALRELLIHGRGGFPKEEWEKENKFLIILEQEPGPNAWGKS